MKSQLPRGAARRTCTRIRAWPILLGGLSAPPCPCSEYAEPKHLDVPAARAKASPFQADSLDDPLIHVTSARPSCEQGIESE